MASSRLRELQKDEGDGLSLDMSPMIDMVFLLLIFFIVSSRLITTTVDTKVEIPVADAAKVTEDATGRFVVNVRSDGTLTIGQGTSVTMEALVQKMEEVRRQNQLDGVKTLLHIRGDRNTAVRHIKEVIRAGGDAGIGEVVFANFVVPGADY